MVERSFRHFSSPQVFHSVVYRHADVHMPSLNSSLCTSDVLHARLRKRQREATVTGGAGRTSSTGDARRTSTINKGSSRRTSPRPVPPLPGGSWTNSSHFKVRGRLKRSTHGAPPGNIDGAFETPPSGVWTRHKLPPSGRGKDGAPPSGGGDHYDDVSGGERHRERYRRHRRHKRAIDPTKTTCTLFVQADHLFYQKFHSNTETVIEQLTQHVQGVNDIYRPIGKY